MDRVALYFANESQLYFMTVTERKGCGRDLKKDLLKFRRVLYRGLKERNPANKSEWIVKWAPRPRCKAFWVFEHQTNGELHAHGVLAIDHMDKEEMVQRWTRATNGFSWQADISEAGAVTSAAGYMMKYMGKQFQADDDFFREGGHQFADNERRYSFWKPELVKSVPYHVLDNAPKVEPGTIEVELDHSWNTGSKYWMDYEKACRSPGIRLRLEVKNDAYGLPDESVNVYMGRGYGWYFGETGFYNQMQLACGPPFIAYMDYMLCGFLRRWRIDDMNGWHYKNTDNPWCNKWC